MLRPVAAEMTFVAHPCVSRDTLRRLFPFNSLTRSRGDTENARRNCFFLSS